MTLAQIMKLALCQLDEDIADIDDFAELFRHYANQGYEIAVRRYLQPKETFTLTTDENGRAYIDGLDIVRVIELKDESGCAVYADVSGDGTHLVTGRRNAKLTALCEISYPLMKDEAEEPRLPENAHMALVDYICYRHLMNGNMAKQSRAQAYQSSFYQTLSSIRPQGSGSTTRYKNLYAVTSARYAR